MLNVNWQAYEDGSLTAEERAHAEKLLQTDASAMEELNGFRAFWEETRRQGLNESIPAKDLNRLLKEVARAERTPQKLSWARLSYATAFLILIAGGLLWWKHDPMEFATTATVATLESTEPKEAESWIRSKTGYSVPDFRFPPEATVVMARQGANNEWACLDFMQDGQIYFLYMKKNGNSLGNTPSQVFNGNAFYEGQGVGWKTPALSYYLKGGTREGRWSFATHLAPQSRNVT
jgi:hypothetical protein